MMLTVSGNCKALKGFSSKSFELRSFYQKKDVKAKGEVSVRDSLAPKSGMRFAYRV